MYLQPHVPVIQRGEQQHLFRHGVHHRRRLLARVVGAGGGAAARPERRVAKDDGERLVPGAPAVHRAPQHQVDPAVVAVARGSAAAEGGAVALVQHVRLRERQQRPALAAPRVVRVDQDRDLEAVDEARRQAGHRLAVREDGGRVAPRRLARVSQHERGQQERREPAKHRGFM